MTIDDTQTTIEDELRTLLRGIGCSSINDGDIYQSAPSLPAVNILLTDSEQNEMQVYQNGKIGWNLNYDVVVMFSGGNISTETLVAFKSPTL